MDFLKGISRFSEGLQSNPDVQRARMRALGYNAMDAEQYVQPMVAQRQQKSVNLEVQDMLNQGIKTEADFLRLYQKSPEAAKLIMQMNERAKPSSTIGKIQADIEAGLIDPETGAAALKKATTIAPVYDPVTQRLIYAGNSAAGQPNGAAVSSGMPAPSSLPTMPSYEGQLPSDTTSAVSTQTETPDDTATRAELAIAQISQIPPELATSNPKLYQDMAASFLKDIPEQQQKLIGKKKFENAIDQLQDILKVGAEKGFLTSESKPLTENIINRAFSTESGKSLSDFIGNDRATFTQTADSVRSSIMSTMMQAYGLGATQMNTLREMEMIMKQVVSGDVTKEAGDKLINLLREREGFKPKFDRNALEAEAKRRGLRK